MHLEAKPKTNDISILDLNLTSTQQNVSNINIVKCCTFLPYTPYLIHLVLDICSRTFNFFTCNVPVYV